MTATTETTYRVVRMPVATRRAMQLTRDDKKQTNEKFIALAVESQLARIIEALTGLGFGQQGPSVTVKLPFSDETLAALKDGCEKTGIPAVQLLSLCIAADSNITEETPAAEAPATEPAPKAPRARRKASKKTTTPEAPKTKRAPRKAKETAPRARKRVSRKKATT